MIENEDKLWKIRSEAKWKESTQKTFLGSLTGVLKPNSSVDLFAVESIAHHLNMKLWLHCPHIDEYTLKQESGNVYYGG